MGESYQFHSQQLQQHQQQQHQASGSSRLRTSGGEIVEVQGGHIVRSTGRKDRHSKVCTAKGPRDRRVRLSAHTAIQFYDVQDRLGYDRPSKAVDWLIKKAKTAIDELAELPAWKPTTTSVTTPPAARTNPNLMTEFEQNTDQLTQFEQNTDNIVDNQLGNSQNSSFLPPSLDSDSIADTIKSFFPMGASSNPHSNNNHHHHSNNNNNDDDTSGMQFHQSFPPPELISRPGGRSQDLRLSLQSFQDPMINHHHHQQHHHHHQQQQQDGGGENNNMYFDGSSWPDNPTGGYQRMVAWGGDASGVSAGFIFGSSPATAPATATAFLQPLFGQPTNNQLFTNSSQRGPLQSSITPSFRAWIDPPPPFSGVSVDQHPTVAFHHQPSVAGFNSGLGGFTGFRVPARFQGEPEEHDGISDRPSSASSDSHH